MKKQPLDQPSIAPGLRRFLYLTAALTGAAVMIVEILGAKMLAPYLGTSHFVWTAQIAVTLVALACGYYIGGRIVDRSLQLSSLYWGILGAGVYLAVTVTASEPVAYWCLQMDLALGSLLTSTFLFFVPLLLLAMVCPFLVRMLTESVAGVGGNVGRLTSISTLGSFVGTILIGYLLIPYSHNSYTMYGTALALMTVASIYFVVWGRSSQAKTFAPLVLVAGVVVGLLALPNLNRLRVPRYTELLRKNSNFGMLQVVQNKGAKGERLYYLNDYLTQNTYDPVAKLSTSMFTDMLHGLARAYTTDITNVLCIGLGVGIVPMHFAKEGCQVDIVEINPAVVPLAQQYFDLKPELLNITFGDGRYYVNRTAKKYDAIILDAFLGESNPVHLMSREAFTAMRRILKPGGVLVINSFWSFVPNRDFFSASIDKTLQSVFKGVRIHNGGNGNLFFVASETPNLAMVHPPDLSNVHPDALQLVQDAYDGIRLMKKEHGRVLTDDYNPVEFYDAANRESIRRQLALGMKPTD